ncbi:uncharacterized protein LOC135365979 [Ornithodoros turicata]
MITQEILEDYHRDGAVCLRGVFEPRWVEAARKGIEQTMENPGPHSERLQGSSGSAYFNDYCNWRQVPEFVDYVYKSPAAELVGQLMQSKWAAFYHEHVLVKDPGTSRETPWHHDQAYYPIDGFKVCSIWMPVDPVGEETSIQFVAGSHRWGKWFYPRKFATLKNYALGDNRLDHEYEDVPVEEIDGGKHRILKWAVQPGDCIVFHMRTLHGAPGNVSQSVSRRVLSTRWLGDDAVMAKRAWDVSPPTMGGLQPGDAAVSEEFPIIWRRKE